MQHIQIPSLSEGETYIGAIGDKNGYIYHVVLLPGDCDGASWRTQMDWAMSIGGDLPNRIEQVMLWAHHRDQFNLDLYWSNEQDTDPNYSGWAWYRNFFNGSRDSTRQDGALRARAVRRLSI